MTSATGDRPTLVVLAAGQAKRYGGVKPLAPVGPAGEAVIDVLASDALAAGFGRIVLVIGPATGAAIRYHVERTWPPSADVRFALQSVPRGTVDAVMAAAEHLPPSDAFGVANADDLYGEEGLALLAGHVASQETANVLVCYRLRDTLIGDSPVTRGICDVGPDGLLRGVDERRQVTPMDDGRIVARDDREPAELDPDALVSVNLWGFRPAMRAVFDSAMAGAAGDGTAGDGAARDPTGGGRSSGGEVLLPEVVGDLVAGRRVATGDPQRFRVLQATGRCIGVTHPGDLGLVQADLAGQVGRGERAGQLWSATATAQE